MMPVYFHLASHLWIFYLFFVNGFLIHFLLRQRSNIGNGNYFNMTNSLEASLLATFFMSLSVNGCLLLLFDLLNQPFSLMKITLPIVTVGLLLSIGKSGVSRIHKQFKFDFDCRRLTLYVFVFLILFYNGGLIEQVADSWWHMSLVNKIALANSFSPEIGHLTGDQTRYYPPLWHANLALATILSGEPISVLWNSFTAWGGVLKVMGFYLFAFALSTNRPTAFIAAVLFVLLPGMGDSYLRVSAWPSHIAYTAMFFTFFVSFWLLDKYKKHDSGVIASICRNLFELKATLFMLLMLITVTLFVHQLELLWLYIGLMMYAVGVMVSPLLSVRFSAIESHQNDLIILLTWVVLLIGICICVYAFIDDWNLIKANFDWLLVCLVMFSLFLALLLMFVCIQLNMNTWLSKVSGLIIVVAGVLIVCSIDLKQLISLFLPGLAYPAPVSHEWPHLVDGYFGNELKLPTWTLQLRSALLYSGVLSIPLSLMLVIIKPSRLTLFVCINAIVAFLFCVSPYLYLWLAGVLSYHSPWRIILLVFHPIIIAHALYLLWNRIVRAKEL